MDTLKIVYKPLRSLIPYAQNARTHSDHQVNQLAESIREFGFVNPVLIGDDGVIIAGHGRVMAASKLGLDKVPTVVISHLSERQRKALILADNRLALSAGWDMEKLGAELSELANAEYNLELTGFDEQELDALLKSDMALLPDFSQPSGSGIQTQPEQPARVYEPVKEGLTEDDETVEALEQPVSRHGDVWILGEHRVMCGDSTNVDDVAALMNGEKASLVHSDPPYGMGKQSDGVANDNIYREKLDAFQMAWWRAFRPWVANNGSAYIWGNAEELWRLWFVGGLGQSEVIELRNEIVWDKKNIPGMKSPDMTSYPVTSERCLFFQLGNQFLGNVNTDDFPQSWEPVRAYMEAQATLAGITPSDIKRVCGVGMFSHWFTKSQFTLIPENRYKTLAAEYPQAFKKPWAQLKAEWDAVKSGPTSEIQKARSYFDNAHDIMRDVWEFPRVLGDDRLGHATPKPVAMIERAVKSSSRYGDIVVEPFGGSGPTLIACEKLGRKAYVMELVPSWVDVIVRRWERFTGETAMHASGATFEEIKQTR